jgi:hypothetical protein
MRKKIIGMTVIIAVLAMLSIQSVAAQIPVVYTWTDKPQYDPGEKGKLKISILNELPDPVEINNITIWYPWRVYDAEKDEWVGNETIKGDTRILATMTSKGTENDHYYREVGFTVPGDGRAVMSGSISLNIWTNEGPISGHAILSVAAPSLPMSLVDFSAWMTYLIVAVVVCAIILAVVVFLATRKTSAPRTLLPRASVPPPPPKPKAKTG